MPYIPALLALLLSGHLDFLVWFCEAIALGAVLLGGTLAFSGSKLAKAAGKASTVMGRVLLIAGLLVAGLGVLSLLILASN